MCHRFYAQALEPLGYEVAIELKDFVAFGQEGKPLFAPGKEPSTTAHVAFQVESRASVDAFHAAAMACGATDQGSPGVREHYHANYAAFVGDPDGNNVEAMCHRPA